jgi:hypothetical protein
VAVDNVAVVWLLGGDDRVLWLRVGTGSALIRESSIEVPGLVGEGRSNRVGEGEGGNQSDEGTSPTSTHIWTGEMHVLYGWRENGGLDWSTLGSQ